MRKYTSVLVLPLFACLVQAQSFINGQAARAVLGQQEFTFGVALGAGTAQNLLGGPSGLAYNNGRLFVADSNVLGAAAGSVENNNRVVTYDVTQIAGPRADLTLIPSPSPYCGLCGYNAINVLGEPDYTSQGPQPVSSQSLNVPTAIATDGHVFAVADTNNNRVLIWNSIPTTIDQAANIVLGASSFTVPGQPIATQTNFRGPQGIWIQNGKLFVADTQNYRVLIWNSIPTQNNQAADLVLGQPNFSSGTQAACNPTKSNYTAAANEFCNPVSVSSDGTRLFVSDLAFNRVLIWNSIPTSTNQPADVVVGQPTMAAAIPNNPAVCANGAAVCAATLNFPRFALSDGTRLYIADGGNDRVLIFNSIPTTNGASADAVLGQPDFASDVDSSSNAANSIASTAVDNTGSVDTIPSPTALAWDGVNLYVSDPFNRRVLVFTPADTPLPDNSVVNWASEIIRQEGVVSLALPTGGSIVANDTVSVTIQSTAYTYTIKSTDTLDTIAQGLVSAINANSGDPNALAIFAGAGTATIYLSSKATNLGFDSISLTVASSNTADILITASGAYLSAGTAATGAPGMLVEIDGTNLSDQPSASPAVASLSGQLPTSLAGAQVFMDGWAAPLLSVSASQIITQIPYAFTNGTAPSGSISANSSLDRNSTSVYVRTVHSNGSVTVTNPTPVYIAPANPGLFSAPAFAGQARPWPAAGALHQAGNPNAVVSVDGGIHAGDTGTIVVNGRNYTYTVQASDTLNSIVQAFLNLINGIDPQVTASAGGAFTRVILTAIQNGAAGAGIPISATTSANSQVLLTAYTSSTCCVVTPGSTISASNPAAPGEMITLNATGLGLLANSVSPVTGVPFNGPQPNSASTEVTVMMNGTAAQVIGAGLAPGAIGTYQIQVVVPQTLSASADTTVTAAQNDFISNIVTLPVGAATVVTPTPPPTAPASPFAGAIDTPNSRSGAYSGTVAFGGWTLDQNTSITSIGISVDGVFYGTATYGGSRTDACAAFPSSPNCPNVGWNFVFDTTQLADGGHTMQMTATSSDGLHYSASASFTTANASSEVGTRMMIDNPTPQSTPFQGLALFSGWAINDSAAISTVAVSIDGSPIGNASYGGARPDVCTAFPNRPGCPNVGWTILVDTTKLANGTHSVSVLATAANGQHIAIANGFTVANWSTANPTTIHVDIPNAQSGAFSGTAAFGGWAVDPTVAMSTVAIAIDGVSYGNITSGVSRPDVCNALPNSAGCPNVGWSASVDTTLLADGAHTLAITATDVNGHRTTVTTPFSVANLIASNPLKVHIDIPGAQSAAYSGTANFAGWALSGTASISNVQILVDGVSYGPAVFGVARPDVCAVLPGSPDCPNVGWTFAFDTTLLANGAHTLEVTGTSSSGQRGTASMAFNVSNATTGPTRISIDDPSPFSSPFQGLAQFAGWALNDTSAITRVVISVDGVPVGNANYGVSRADVCAAYPNRPGCPNVGWTFLLDTSSLADGSHTLAVTAYAASGAHFAASETFTVANWAAISSPMTINIDTPSSSGGPYFGTVNFGGWAIDQNGAVVSVSVAIDGEPFAGTVYGVSRPDVCAAFPGFAGCPNVGWSFQFNTTLVPNGNHTLAVTATGQTGQSSTVTQKFTVAN